MGWTIGKSKTKSAEGRKGEYMIHKILASLILAGALLGLSGGAALANGTPTLELPPGIQKQAEPLVERMMEHMKGMGMSQGQMELMMADMQRMADQLPPGIFLQLLELMPQLDMDDMMSLHQEIREGGLLDGPPGRVISFVRRLTR
jgi:hypothetical protein